MIDVWNEISLAERGMDDLVREFLGPRARLSYPGLRLFPRRPFLPATDVFARGEGIVVRMELPGIDPGKDVTVTLDDGRLVVHGERKRAEEVEDEAYYRMEAEYGTFERRILVPDGVEEKDIVAEYVDGILEVTMPKAAKARQRPETKRIAVKVRTPEKTAAAA